MLCFNFLAEPRLSGQQHIFPEIHNAEKRTTKDDEQMLFFGLGIWAMMNYDDDWRLMKPENL